MKIYCELLRATASQDLTKTSKKKIEKNELVSIALLQTQLLNKTKGIFLGYRLKMRIRLRLPRKSFIRA